MCNKVDIGTVFFNLFNTPTTFDILFITIFFMKLSFDIFINNDGQKVKMIYIFGIYIINFNILKGHLSMTGMKTHSLNFVFVY